MLVTCSLDTHLSGTAHLNITADQVFPFMAIVNLQLNGHLQHDNVPCHKTHTIAKFLCFSCLKILWYKPCWTSVRWGECHPVFSNCGRQSFPPSTKFPHLVRFPRPKDVSQFTGQVYLLHLVLCGVEVCAREWKRKRASTCMRVECMRESVCIMKCEFVW